MSLERNGRKYGDHILVGDNGEAFFDQSPLDKSLDLAWSDGCPVGVRLTKEPEEGGRGAEIMAKRYGEVNFWGGMIKRVLNEQGRSDLVDQFAPAEPRKRTKEEFQGTHDKGWAPEELQDHLLVTPEGYSIPRIIIAYVNDAKQGNSVQKRQQRVVTVLNSLEQLSQDAANVKELMIGLTQSLVDEGGDVKVLLKNTLPQGKIDEDNCVEEYRETLAIMDDIAPDLYDTFMNISPEERIKTGMVYSPKVIH